MSQILLNLPLLQNKEKLVDQEDFTVHAKVTGHFPANHLYTAPAPTAVQAERGGGGHDPHVQCQVPGQPSTHSCPNLIPTPAVRGGEGGKLL